MVMTTEVDTPLRADAGEYYHYAVNLKRCGVYAMSNKLLPSDCRADVAHDDHRWPGYALLLLPLMDWPPTASMIEAVQWLQAVLSTATVLVIFLVGRRLGSTVGWLAATATALSPHLITANVYILSESAFTFGLAAFVLCAIRLCEQPGAGRALSCGAVLALTTLVRPTTLYFVVALVPFVWWKCEPNRLRICSATLAAFLVVYAPWVLFQMNAGPAPGKGSLSIKALNSGGYVDLMIDGNRLTRNLQHRHDPTFHQRDTAGKVLAHILEQARREPLTYLHWYLVGKPLTYLGWNTIDGIGDVFVYPVRQHGFERVQLLRIAHTGMKIIHWPVTWLALSVCVLAWWPRYDAMPVNARLALQLCTLVIGYFIAIHTVGNPLPRYAVPIRPLLFVCAAFGLVELATRWQRRNAAIRRPTV